MNAQRAMEQEAGVGAGTKGPADALQGLPDDKGKEPADEALGASEWSGDEALAIADASEAEKSRIRNQRPARPKVGPEVQDEQLKLVAELLIHSEGEAMQTGSGSGSFSASGSESLHI